MLLSYVNYYSGMKRGFNKYGNVGEDEDSFSEQSNHTNQNRAPFNLISQFANLSPGNSGFSDNMIITLFQIVEQQSQALQGLMTKV